MLVLEWKEIAFIEKVNSGCLCWFPTAILVHESGTPIWRLHTKLYEVAWNILAITSYSNISFWFSWLLPLDGSQCIFCKLRSLNWFQTFNTFFWLLLVPDPCTPLKKHSFLFPFSLLKNWGDCLFCGGEGRGGGGVKCFLDLSLFP